jgi:hypothetical protein
MMELWRAKEASVVAAVVVAMMAVGGGGGGGGIGGAGCAGLPSFSRSPNVSSSYLKLCIRPIQGDALLFCLSL